MFKLTIMPINLYRNWNEKHFLFRYFWATRSEFGLPDFPVGLSVGYHPIFVKFEPCFIETCVETCIETCIDTYIETCIDLQRSAETCIETCVETCIETCIETFIETFIETCIETCIDILDIHIIIDMQQPDIE